MEENKNLTGQEEILQEETLQEDFDIAEAVKAQKKTSKKPRKQKQKTKKLRNQMFLKRGSYSLGITAAVIAGIIVFNVLISALTDRFVLEFDMTTEKDNSISQENIDYIKSVKDEVEVVICATEDEYTGGYMSYFAQAYGVTEDATPYFTQTINLIKRYNDYNNNIKITFADTQSSEFNAISSKYPNNTLSYGDIIVSATKNDTERYKIIGFTDVYEVYTDDTYAAYGMSTGSVTSNKIETALTGAISYVLSSESKKIAVLTGHSSSNITDKYITLLEDNNYTVEKISDTIITSIPNEYDAIVIAAPANDFLGSELDAIAKFLENDGKLNRGLVFFASTTSPYLPNFYDFLSQWGITVDEGILFETNENNYIPSIPTALGSYSSGADDITSAVNVCISDNNVPLTIAFEKDNGITVTSLVDTPDSTVAAPIGTTADWSGACDYEKQKYSTMIQAKKMTYDENNNEIANYIIAFSSTDFIYSDYSEQYSISNKDLTLAAAERAALAENGGISFISKTIKNESFATSVTQSSANLILVIFMVLLPVITIILAIYVYIKRRNA
ncbi:MAG: GldG family protein [Clostridia bacterium]|nr:GldG family protein [Clostridia bacterium]